MGFGGSSTAPAALEKYGSRDGGWEVEEECRSDLDEEEDGLHSWLPDMRRSTVVRKCAKKLKKFFKKTNSQIIVGLLYTQMFGHFVKMN